jgi:hypothetical protein
MSYYLETMDGIDTNSLQSTNSLDNYIPSELELLPNSTNRVLALNNDNSENSKEEEDTDNNNNNDGFVRCASKVPSTDFVATYLVLSKEKINWISRNAEQYQYELLQPMMNRSKYNRNVRIDNDFDFFQDLEVRDITKLKIVSVNHVGCNEKISDSYVADRMKFLNLKKKNKELIELVKKELKDDRDDLMDKIRGILCKLLLQLAKNAGVRNNDGSTCKSHQQLCHVFRDSETKEDAVVFWKIYYDYVTKFPNWQFDIATSAMIKMRFIYEPEELRITKEITFAERLCTFVITQLRKSLNKYGKNGKPGFKLARVRSLEHASIKGKSSNYIWPEYIKCWEVSAAFADYFLKLVRYH